MSELFPGSTPPAAIPEIELLPKACPKWAPEFFSMLGNPLRWQMLQMLSDGKLANGSQIAKRLGRDYDMVNKHLKMMRKWGLIRSVRGHGDKRCEWFYLAQPHLTEPGVLNYGWCRVALPGGQAQQGQF